MGRSLAGRRSPYLEHIAVAAVERTARGWYGIAGFAALLSGPVLYYVFRAIYGGPGTPAREAGDAAIAIAEAEAAEDAA